MDLRVVELPNFSRLCISYFLLYNQYPQNSATCDNLLSHSLCGPWIQEQLGWVVLVQGFPQGCNRDITEVCSRMKTWGFYSKTVHTRGCGQEVLVSPHRGLSRGCFIILTAWQWIPSKGQSRREWEKGGCNTFYGPFSEGTYHPFHFFSILQKWVSKSSIQPKERIHLYLLMVGMSQNLGIHCKATTHYLKEVAVIFFF